MAKQQTKILFFTNLPVQDVRSVGGATTLSQRIFDFLKKDNRLQVKHVQIRKLWKPKFQLIDYFLWLFRFPFVIYKYDVVSFHTTRDYHITVAPFLWLWAKLLRKKTLYHLFGGGFHRQYQKAPFFMKWLLRKTIINSDAFVVETKEMISFFEKMGQKNLVWLPNSREAIQDFNKNRKFDKKFVFISRLMPDKGIPEIIQAAELLPNDYQIDAYGPLDPKFYKTNPFDNTKVNYKGVLHRDEIINTLDKYNVLLMPTYIDREGYPGIIIEALSIGIPVITTKCCVMHEMIQDKHNGLLIEKRNAKALADAIQFFNKENYPAYSQNAYKSFENFDSSRVFSKLIKAYLE